MTNLERQGQLPGFEAPVQAPLILQGKQAASLRMFNAQYFGIESESFSKLTDADLELAHPNRIHTQLYGNSMGEHGFWRYVDMRRRWVAISPEEEKIIPISPRALANRAAANSMASQGALTRPFADRKAVADRASAHIQESFIKNMGQLASGYEQLISITNWADKEFKTPYFAHLKPVDLNMRAHQLLVSFEGMIHVAAIAQNWSSDKRDVALLALHKRLLQDGGTKERFESKRMNWRQYAINLGQYAFVKTLLVEQQIEKCRSVQQKVMSHETTS